MKHFLLTLSAMACLSIPVAAGEAVERLEFKPVPEKLLAEAEALPDLRWGFPRWGWGFVLFNHLCAKTLVQGLAAYSGNRDADEGVLKQIRNVLLPNNCLTAVGGYSSQHERPFTTMVILAKNTPELWEKLTDEEKYKLDLLMMASLVSAAVSLNDMAYVGPANRVVDGRGATMTGDMNLHRDWGPNYQEGYVGGIMMGACYFGLEEAQKLLEEYDHEAFCEKLLNANLMNTYIVFSGKKDNDEPQNPNMANRLTAERINAEMNSFRYYGKTTADARWMYFNQVFKTYNRTVNAGLNDGKGKEQGGKISGMILDDAENLPNVGKMGMLTEFNSMDGGGNRSCAVYAFHGFLPNMCNLIAMTVSGNMDFESQEWKDGYERIKIGNTDLFYKLEMGYSSYSKGQAYGNTEKFGNPNSEYEMMRDLWLQVVEPSLDAFTK